jgi:anti-anti-sigma factor
MKYRFTRAGRISISVIKISGQLDGQTYRSLIAKAREVVKNGIRNILLDLGDLVYISSAGLVSLHDLFNDARREPARPRAGLVCTQIHGSQPRGGLQNLKLLNRAPGYQCAGYGQLLCFLEVFTDKQKAIDSF